MAGKKIGRNDPCPCGSGKKYKNCCLKRDTILESEEVFYNNLRGIHDRIMKELLAFTRNTYGIEFFEAAWDQFVLGRDWYLDEDSEHNQTFIPWMLFKYMPTPGRETAQPIAATYLQKYSYKFSALEKQFLKESLRQPLSFFEVLECEKGRGFVLQDIFRGDIVKVMEHSASEIAEPHVLLYGQVLPLEPVGMLMAAAAIFFPPDYKIDVLDFQVDVFQKETPIQIQELEKVSDTLREFYFTLYERIMTPKQILNTDGDPIVPHIIYYDIESPQAVFPLLKGLAVGLDDEELLSEAEYDEQGALSRISFPWFKGPPSAKGEERRTVLAHITLDGQEMEIFVNSENRARRIREKIAALAGDRVRYRTTKVESLSSPDKREDLVGQESGALELEDVMLDPAAQEVAFKELERHWEEWPNMQIPALNGQTPLEAIQTPLGREKVKALLDMFEQQEKKSPFVKQIDFIRKMRKQLGL